MNKTLVIHIGGHKTGSTTIQEAFAAGEVQLKEAQVLYPARLDHNYLRADILSHINGTDLPKRGPRMLSFAQLAERIRETQARYTLLSAEYFETVEPQVLKDIITQYFAPVVDDIRIIAYVRPHMERLVSGYREALKIGWFQGGIEAFFDQSLADGSLQYAPRFTAWHAAFGEAFILRPMVRDQLLGDSVLTDFVQTAFRGETIAALPEDMARNVALDLKDEVFVQMMQEPFQSRQNWFRHTFGWELARQLQAVPRDPEAEVPAQHLDRTLAQRVHEVCHADAEAMDATFFDGTDLFQTALKVAAQTASAEVATLAREDVFRPDMMRNITALRTVLEDVFQTRHNWSAHFHGHRVKAVERQRGPQATSGQDES